MRQQDDQRRDVAIAWYTAALMRREKTVPLPSLETLLGLPQNAQPQPLSEMRANLRRISEQIRVPLKEKVH